MICPECDYSPVVWGCSKCGWVTQYPAKREPSTDSRGRVFDSGVIKPSTDTHMYVYDDED